jgi:hypothetical protein
MTATDRLTIEISGKSYRILFARPIDLHEIMDYLISRCGKRPPILTQSAEGYTIATY